ncbi:virulence factor TspB C-terminal domain-related protein [Pseudomonas sp. SCB32]|uniref:virulence factor TspB C-terminal domain-related protein n=1 Tax=Pseudomonas sp. SCB32 TaxID=2653853 RepID=UPI0021147D7E|nr:virulence factor TspB C-terminal domain-related protein [Pseudomonas sp. SCB32]
MRALVLFLLVLTVSTAQAEDYYWQYYGYNVTRAPTPAGACQGMMDYWNRPDGLYVDTMLSVSVSGSSGTCYYQTLTKATGKITQHSGKLVRFGDGCTAPKVYDKDIGECIVPEKDKCLSTIGQMVEHQHKIGALSEGGVVLQNTRTEPPGSLCQGSCQYASTGEAPSRCYRFMEGGDQNSGFCVFRYKGNGVICPNTDPTPNTPPAALPTREKSNECTNKVTDAEGRVHYSCLATDTFKEPGNMQCGEVNGVFGCKEGKPSPTQKQTETKTEVSEKTASDGSSTTSTTTTTTTTNCSGVNACSSTTSVTNGTSKTNADGTSGGESSSCTGTGCKASDKPGEENKDDKEEEEEPEREVSGTDDCDASVQCSGDAIDCAMVEQQKKLRCEVEKQGDFEKNKGQIEAAVKGDKFQLTDDLEVEAPSFLNSGTRFLPSSCPTDKTFSLRTNGGRTFAFTYAPLCAAASDLGVLLLIGTSVFCALYVGRAFGGE